VFSGVFSRLNRGVFRPIIIHPEQNFSCILIVTGDVPNAHVALEALKIDSQISGDGRGRTTKRGEKRVRIDLKMHPGKTFQLGNRGEDQRPNIHPIGSHGCFTEP
jgi:hypothetical protein